MKYGIRQWGDSMKNKVSDILDKLDIPVKYILRPKIDSKNKMGISYHFFSEGDNLYGDGEGKEFGGVVQLDLFSIIGYDEVTKQIIELMKENKFRLADSRDSDDSFSSVQYYHKILIFNYIEREVLKNGG